MRPSPQSSFASGAHRFPVRSAWSPADIITIALVLGFALMFPSWWMRADGTEMLHMVSPSGVRIVSLHGDRVFNLDGPLGQTRVRLDHQQVWIEEAPCRNQLCKKMGTLKGPGRALVCIPNRVHVWFAGVSADVDAVTQ